ncbi:hypothetical protein SKAU_G00161580 [Synaphobranchus kaupii]|uniref:Uncharacterized protein n=1 Tax=Synaphobranchus kaupii TaxID=118154 RepID=A0A9Q1FIL5_SYNKA|nr:hypothetical protein SKAU_G00161580 [Synaphobranchus kaupii]
MCHISRAELALHCRRTTRGTKETKALITQLIPAFAGTLPGATFYQAYLVDGSARWNEDRSAAATPHQKDEPHSYSDLLRHAVNSLGEAVLGRKIVLYTAPRKYTGELIGLEYLYNQTGEVLQDYASAIQELETATVADVEEDEGFVGSEEFQDLTDLTVPTLDLDNLPSAPLTTAHCELSISKESDQLSTSEDSSSHDDFGGPDNIEGYRSVQDLADYLVTL